MTHDEHEGCCCNHESFSHTENHNAPIEVTESQKEFLHTLSHSHYLPVARFTVKDSREESFASTALAPVYICSADDDMKVVKETGVFLQTLEDMGFITLDYDIPLNGFDYNEYKTSELYKYFCETVAEGASKSDFLGNTPELELGSIALTEEGEQIASAHCEHDHDHHHHG
jgi:hypothetical protein